MKGIPFKVFSKKKRSPAGKLKGESARKGLAIGRCTDFAFQKIVERKERLSTRPGHRRLRQIFEALRQMGVRPIKCQFQVAIPNLGLKTSLDCLGLTADGNPVVIELKCTQFTLEQHDDRYEKTCVQNAMLANGVRNTEKNAHMLQCGFGMLAVKSNFPPGTPVYGKVVYSAEDGCRTYNCDSRWVAPRLFSLGARSVTGGGITSRAPTDVNAKLGKLPDIEVNRQPFLDFAAKYRCPGIQPDLQGYGSYVGGAGTASKPFCVVGIVHAPDVSPTTKRMKAATDRVVTDARRLQRLKVASKCKVRAALLIHGSNRFVWKTCRVPRASKCPNRPQSI